MIRERMKGSQSLQKSYHDKIRKALEFQVDDHVFLRVTPVTGVGRALKLRKRIDEVAYWIALPPSLVNLHEVVHVSQLRIYISNPSHVIQMDDVQGRDNLTIEASPVRIEGQEVKQLQGKEITLVKVLRGGPASESLTWG
ncbi:uncharacterized protein LOC131604805 [Vicia villosa]|uniref:uncharacterized protein LOC131604805 n=1 Tax=Vicia villosa TaxID=3911 RepID=UPI00273B7493|nr:uncharacterized protein LOC131604805 [Vicia villosa]